MWAILILWFISGNRDVRGMQEEAREARQVLFLFYYHLQQISFALLGNKLRCESNRAGIKSIFQTTLRFQTCLLASRICCSNCFVLVFIVFLCYICFFSCLYDFVQLFIECDCSFYVIFRFCYWFFYLSWLKNPSRLLPF